MSAPPCKGCMASAQSHTYPSKGNLHFPAPFPDLYIVKLCCTTSFLGSQHNRMLGRRSETKTGWIFNMRTSLPKEKGTSSTLLLKAVVLCFVLGRGCSLAYLCLAQFWWLPASVLPPLFTGAACDIPGVSPLPFAWPWADIGCGTVQMNNPRISTTAGTELWLWGFSPFFSQWIHFSVT